MKQTRVNQKGKERGAASIFIVTLLAGLGTTMTLISGPLDNYTAKSEDAESSSQSYIQIEYVGNSPKIVLNHPIEQEQEEEQEVEEPEPGSLPSLDTTEDRTLPIYEVYKGGYFVDVSAEIQWMIRDFAEKYDFDEKIIYGLCLTESTFQANATSGGGAVKGLAQINEYWIRTSAVERFEENPSERNLYDPYDNLLTLMEIWSYARTAYNINTGTVQGMKDLLYWHNSGSYIANVSWSYSNKCFSYAGELVEISY